MAAPSAVDAECSIRVNQPVDRRCVRDHRVGTIAAIFSNFSVLPVGDTTCCVEGHINPFVPVESAEYGL